MVDKQFPKNLALVNSLDGFWENVFYGRQTDARITALALLISQAELKGSGACMQS